MIKAKDLLPLTEVFYGPLKYDLNRANFTIGRLKCTGKYQADDQVTSCQTLKKDGHYQSSIYTLKRAEDKFPRLAYCDMSGTAGYDDPAMETLIGYVNYSPMPEAVMFSAYMAKEGWIWSDQDLVYNRVYVNREYRCSYSILWQIFTSCLDN